MRAKPQAVLINQGQEISGTIAGICITTILIFHKEGSKLPTAKLTSRFSFLNKLLKVTGKKETPGKNKFVEQLNQNLELIQVTWKVSNQKNVWQIHRCQSWYTAMAGIQEQSQCSVAEHKTGPKSLKTVLQVALENEHIELGYIL